MRIVGVCACVAGIAHTYLAQQKLVDAATARGHEICVETQGVIGQENELTSEQIRNADVVILAVDVSITGRERFKGKKVVEVPTSAVVKNANGLIQKLERMLSA
ncbi:PTS fructose transporter subunit IIB [Olsenella profusa]|uniref:Putative fructose-like phosphotransferase enzyme IIB component 2 n=1 Tax=Olsenella profusa F0195 TaxID=1125712 RepID=U2TK40_9ACTN|nr:PTS fructose transporter subunit IIB [Olsenella profusa]ERL06563.1 putative fructose-like phosphotransferase enzyme IIB component 2 [Olsenella profusa F0195]